MRTLFLSAFILFSGAAANGVVCTDEPFGAANLHNLFVLGNLEHRHSGTEGRVAVGGTAIFSRYGLGRKVNLKDGGPLYVLNVGGHLSFTDGTLWNGLIGYGISYGYRRVGFARSFAPPGSVSVAQSPDPYDSTDHPHYYTYMSRDVDYAAAARHLLGINQLWKAMPANAPFAKAPGEVTVQGVDSRLNVFEVPAAALNAATHLVIEAPATSTVLLNVVGTELVLKNFGFTLRGVRAENVVLNLGGVRRLEMSAIGVKGTILAPEADVEFTNGRMDGLLVAGSFKGEGQMGRLDFAGCLPSLPESVQP